MRGILIDFRFLNIANLRFLLSIRVLTWLLYTLRNRLTGRTFTIANLGQETEILEIGRLATRGPLTRRLYYGIGDLAKDWVG